MRLSAKGRAGPWLREPVVGRIIFAPVSMAERSDHVLAGDEPGPDGTIEGYAGVLSAKILGDQVLSQIRCPLVHGVTLDHLEDGDVVVINPNGYVRTLYRMRSKHNAIFATDRCNSYCLMCSQPPRDVDDGDRIREHLRLIELMSPETKELGITGGEPTLLKDDLLTIVARCKDLLPRTALHMLSNGRLFYYDTLAKRLAEIAHPDLMVGIPVYSDLDDEHDYVVQSRGAFHQTMIGLQNLGRFGVKVEIRVVIHRLTFRRLPEVAEFIYRNLTFASHVVLMGLEMMGFTLPNLEELWVDPWDYREELERATMFLAARGMPVSVYNHQLCTVPEPIWPYCRKSISDWKNEYLPVCDGCIVRDVCGGFFTSSLQRRYSTHISPF